MSMLVTI